MKKIALIFFVLVFFALSACGGGSPPAVVQSTTVETSPTQAQSQTRQETKVVSFSKDIMPIFNQFSDSHHSAGSVYSLESYEDLMKDVVQGNPEQSKLYQRLIGQGGPVMPPGNKLPDNLIALIYDWIKQGAKNN
jgi:hypothetical protein